MLVDALGVRAPTDGDGNARLMLNIVECVPKTQQVGSLLTHRFSLLRHRLVLSRLKAAFCALSRRRSALNYSLRLVKLHVVVSCASQHDSFLIIKFLRRRSV